MMAENNEVNIKGIKPAHDSDDFPVTQDTADDLQSTGYCMAYESTEPAWVELACNVDGNLLVVSA